MFGGPIVSTSANISGEKPLFDANEAVELFAHREHQPDLIVGGGVIPERAGSTVVKIDGDDVSVLRQGEITL